MIRTFAILAFALLACAAARAATLNTQLVVKATGAQTFTSVTANGTASLTNIGSGTFAATLSVTSQDASGNYSAPFTITLDGGGGTITGTLRVPVSLLTGTGTGSAIITGGSGPFAGATGTFPALTGTGSLDASGLIIAFQGNGTITTGGGPAGPPSPAITDVLDSASNTPNVAQGSIFIVKGTNLCPSGTNFFGIPRPTVSPDGVKITFTPTAIGAGTDAILVYTFNPAGVCQLAAILPSTVELGTYNVTVTSGTVSPPFPATVVPRKLTLFTQDSSGSGMASVQNFISQGPPQVVDLNSFTTGAGKSTTISPAKPGQFLIAYGTGLGPLAGGDNTAAPAFDFSANGVSVRAVVGGVSIPVTYAGRAGFAGEDQINFALPGNVPTGCTVPFQVSVDGVLSNATFIAIAPDANSRACVQPGFTTTQLQQYDNGASFTAGFFSLTQISETLPQLGTVKANSAAGGFTKFTGFQLAGLAQYQAQTTTTGACAVTHFVGTSSQAVLTSTVAGLDAGAVALNGPAASNIANRAFVQDGKSNAYSLDLGAEGLGIPGGSNATIVAGTYTVAGAGGKDVGKFNASVTIGTPLAITGGLPSVVNRSAGLTLNWTGGNASDLVEIFGATSSLTVTGPISVADTWSFVCTTNAGAKTFTVPASVLTQLPPVAANAIASGTGAGLLEVISGVISPFTAPLAAGGNIDSGVFTSLVGTGAFPAYQ